MMKEEISGSKFLFSFTGNIIELFDKLQHFLFGISHKCGDVITANREKLYDDQQKL